MSASTVPGSSRSSAKGKRLVAAMRTCAIRPASSGLQGDVLANASMVVTVAGAPSFFVTAPPDRARQQK